MRPLYATCAPESLRDKAKVPTNLLGFPSQSIKSLIQAHINICSLHGNEIWSSFLMTATKKHANHLKALSPLNLVSQWDMTSPAERKKYSSEELEPATYLKWITTSHRKILLRDDSIKAQL
jgi:hypothetical protein